jgi:hypothetical protein
MVSPAAEAVTANHNDAEPESAVVVTVVFPAHIDNEVNNAIETVNDLV